LVKKVVDFGRLRGILGYDGAETIWWLEKARIKSQNHKIR